MRLLSISAIIAPAACSIQQKYERLTASVMPDKVFCGEDESRAFAWDFKQDKILKLLPAKSKTSIYLKVDSLTPGAAIAVLNSAEVAKACPTCADFALSIAKEGLTVQRILSPMRDCTDEIRRYFTEFKSTNLCGNGVSAKFYQGFTRGVFEVSRRGNTVIIPVEINRVKGFKILYNSEMGAACTAAGVRCEALEIRAEGLNGFSIKPEFGLLRFCK
jgi:hypothetical protein